MCFVLRNFKMLTFCSQCRYYALCWWRLARVVASVYISLCFLMFLSVFLCFCLFSCVSLCSLVFRSVFFYVSFCFLMYYLLPHVLMFLHSVHSVFLLLLIPYYCCSFCILYYLCITVYVLFIFYVTLPSGIGKIADGNIYIYIYIYIHNVKKTHLNLLTVCKLSLIQCFV
jgi:hypothetical protein